MASLADRKDGTEYTGRTPESIARRIWGRSAEVRPSADPANRVGEDARMGMVVYKDRYGTHVLASVVIRRES